MERVCYLQSVRQHPVIPEFGGCFAFCVVRGVWGWGVSTTSAVWGLVMGSGNGGFVPGAGVCSDGGEGSVL